MIRHRSPISGVDAWGARYVATAGYDSQVILWDAARKQSLTRANHDHLVNQCRFSTCGRYLITSSSDYSARVWSVPDLQLVSVLNGHDDDVEMAVPSPDGEFVATASRDHDVRIFSRSGTLLHRLRGHTADVISVEWIRDGRELVSSSDDGTVRRWSAARGAAVETVDLGGIESDTVVYADNGFLYVGNDTGDIVPIKDGILDAVHAHQSGIKRLVYHAATRTLLSAGYDRTIRLWDVLPNGALRRRHEAEAPASIWLRSAAFAGPALLVFGTFGSGYAAYDVKQGVWDLDLVDDTAGVNAVRCVAGEVFTVGDAGVVCRDERPLTRLGSLCNFLGDWQGRVVTGGHLGILFDAESGAALHRHHSPLNCCTTFRRDGEEQLIVGAYTGEGLVFRMAADGEPKLVATLQLHDNAIKGLACNDRQIFSVCATGAAAWHRIDDLGCERRVADAHEKISNGAACLPDGRFVSVSRDRKLRIWAEQSATVVPTPHDHSVKCVAVSRDGSLIAAGSYDGKVALYDWRRGSWVRLERLSAFGISSVAPAVEPRGFLASSYDGRVYAMSLGAADRPPAAVAVAAATRP
jgi:WD40 repeat protein